MLAATETQRRGSGNRISVDPHVPEAGVDLERHGRCLTSHCVYILRMFAGPSLWRFALHSITVDEYGDRRMAMLSIVISGHEGFCARAVLAQQQQPSQSNP